MNWTNYKDYWDQYYSNWYNTSAIIPSDPFFGGKSTLCNYETPEPYYFGGNLPSEGNVTFPDNSIEAVILNVNPGTAQPNEWIKFWQHKHNAGAFIISNCYDYHTLNDNCNPLTTQYTPWDVSKKAQIPGFDWWDSKRFSWLDRFIQRSAIRSQVFAIEPCPWHSINANSIDYGFLKTCPAFQSYFQDYVIDPATDAIRASRLKGGQSQKPFGIWFGNKDLKQILVNNFSFKVTASWDQNSGLPSWPVNKNNMPVARKYELLEGTDSFGNECRFLFLTYPNVGVNAPSKAFRFVDQDIKSMI